MAGEVDPYNLALRLLTGRDYTVAALTAKLARRGCPEASVQASIARLLREGFLDDRRYAERFVEACRTNGRYLGYRLRQELRRRGVAAELIASVLAESPETVAELELARELVVRRYSGFNPALADDRERRRIAGFLQRRGFGVGTIRTLLDRRACLD